MDIMFQHKEYICKTPINAADMLRGWAMFKQSPQKNFNEKELKKLLRDAEKEYTGQNIKTKIGKNDPCPCGSGKKYKKCCGK